jgi:hypothetical protein
MCPLGKNNSDPNDGGQSFRNGTPIDLTTHDFGNIVNWATPNPAEFGNPIPSSGTNENRVTWQPSPSHFGNQIGGGPSAPTVVSLNVTSGPAAGGTSVTVTGTNFMTGAEVVFGDSPATSVTVVSSTEITCDTPAGSGEVSVTVINTDAQSGTLDDAWTWIGSNTLIASTAATNDGAFAGQQTTDPIDTTGANFLIVCADQGFGAAALSVSDSYSNTWQALTPAQAGGCPQLFYCYAPTVGTGHTFTASAVSDDVSIAVAAFSGLNGTSSVYQSGSIVNSASGASGTTKQAGDITPASLGDLVINGLGWWKSNAAPMVSIDTDFTVLDLTGIGNLSNAVLAYLVAPSTATVNPTWTMSIAPQGSFFATGAAFAQE